MHPGKAQLLSFALDAAPLLYAVFDANSRMLEANHHTETLVGREVLGCTLQDLFVDFSSQLSLDVLSSHEAFQPLDVSVAGHTPQTYLVRVIRAEDHYVCLGHADTRGMQDLAAEVLELNRELANTTRELTRRKAELERLSALKDQFLGMAAHDLRGPIGIIMNYSEFLLDEAGASLSTEHIGFLETILSTSLRMRDLIEGFLDLSVIESGNLRLEAESCDVAELIVDSLRLVEYSASQAGIRLISEPLHPSTSIRCDRGKVIQVLSNVLSNAVKHSPDGAIVCTSCSVSRDCVEIRITDQGKGIPEELRRVISEPFSSTGKGLRGERSHGLGLAIAHKVLEAHRGALIIEQTGSEGTTMLIRLPMEPHPEKEDHHA